MCCWRWEPARNSQKADSLLSAASLCGTEVLPLGATTLRILGSWSPFAADLVCVGACVRVCACVHVKENGEDLRLLLSHLKHSASKMGYHSRKKFGPGRRGRRQAINQSTWDLWLYFKQRIEKSICKTLSETAEVVMKSNWEVIVRFMGKYRQNSRLASLLPWNRRN